MCTDGRAKVGLPESISKPADAPMMESTTGVCSCARVSEERACASDSRLRRIAESGIKCGVVLQIGAPKCAVCWTTYAGLINVGWLAAESANPLWLAFATLTLIISLAAGLQRA